MMNLNPKFRTYVTLKEQNNKLEWDLLDIQNCSYPYSDKVRIQKQLIDNIDLIKDKNILDLGCHNGIFLDAMIQLGAKAVLGTNVRSDMIGLANEAITKSGYNNATVIYNDIYDLNALEKLLPNVETIHLCGLLYHINNHFELLCKISDSKASSLILDSIYYLPDWYDQQPKVTWRRENPMPTINGMDVKTPGQNIFVGIPNLQWYIESLPMLGWTIKNIDYVTFMHFKSKIRRRVVITCTR